MLVQRCALSQNRLILPVSVTKPSFHGEGFQSAFTSYQYRALVDTGAQRTVLSRSVIAELSLVRTGHVEFASLHGPKTHGRYLAGIALWVRRIDETSKTNFDDAELSLFSIEQPFEVVDMEQNHNFDMILGFDVLKMFSFSFDVRSKEFEIIVQT